MGGIIYQFDSKGIESLQRVLEEQKQVAFEVINDVLENEAKDLFISSITDLIPVSNRNKKHAKTSNPLMAISGELSLTISAKKQFQYLYFPNDGSNTKNHVGNLDFMGRGLKAQEENIINKILDRISEKTKEEL